MQRTWLTIWMVCLMAGAAAVDSEASQRRFALRATALSPDIETTELLGTGSRLESSSMSAALTVEYDFKVTDAWAVCSSLSLAALDFRGAGGALDTNPAAEMWFLPFSVTVRYEILLYSQWQPYVGAGINAAFLLRSEIDDILKGLGVDEISTSTKVRAMLEAGVLFHIDNRTFASLDASYCDAAGRFDLESDESGDLGRAELSGSYWTLSLGYGWRF